MKEYSKAMDAYQKALELDSSSKVFYRAVLFIPVLSVHDKSQILTFSIICPLHLQEASEGIQRCMVSQAMRNDSPEEVKKRAMADPEVQQIMSDPAMRMILEQMQKDPQALSE